MQIQGLQQTKVSFTVFKQTQDTYNLLTTLLLYFNKECIMYYPHEECVFFFFFSIFCHTSFAFISETLTH